MRTVVIGGTGHIGSYLTPRLVDAGHDVTCITRGSSSPYHPHTCWRSVKMVTADRQAEDHAGTFAARVADLKPQVVIDLVCFEPDSAQQLRRALAGKVQHFLHCGTMWVHGRPALAPTTEETPRRPFCEYGKRKAAIEADLMEAARRDGFPATVLHPGHIVGEGWWPINPQGHLSQWVWRKLAHGEELDLPNMGNETLHHVHADDVAQAFMQAIHHWGASVGESFHVVSEGALTLRGYAQGASGWFGHEANLRYLPWDQWAQGVTEQEAAITLDHLAHSPNGSIAKARRLLDYAPRYTSLEALSQSVHWLLANGQLTL